MIQHGDLLGNVYQEGEHDFVPRSSSGRHAFNLISKASSLKWFNPLKAQCIGWQVPYESASIVLARQGLADHDPPGWQVLGEPTCNVAGNELMNQAPVQKVG